MTFTVTTITVVGATVLLLVAAACAAAWWAWHSARAASRDAYRARRRTNAMAASQVPLETLLQGWGMSPRRAEQFAQEVRDKVKREVGTIRAVR